MSDDEDYSDSFVNSFNEICYNEDNIIINPLLKENEIQKYIVNKLVHYYIFNEKLISLFKRKYENFKSKYFT